MITFYQVLIWLQIWPELMLRVWQTYLIVSLGSYGVILDERHYRDLLMQHVVPPVAKVSIVLEKLVRSYWNMLTWGIYKNYSLHDFVMLTTSVLFQADTEAALIRMGKVFMMLIISNVAVDSLLSWVRSIVRRFTLPPWRKQIVNVVRANCHLHAAVSR